MAEIGLSSLLHSFENHRANFLWCLQGANLVKGTCIEDNTTYKFAVLAIIFHVDHRAVVLTLHCERQVLEVAFDFRLVHPATNEALCVEYCVFRI